MDMHDATLGDGPGGPPFPAFSATAVVDARGTVVGWSEGAERLLGHSREEAVSSPVDRLLGPDVPQATGRLLARSAGWSGTAELRHRDGRTLPVWLEVHPSLNDAGALQWLVVALPADRVTASRQEGRPGGPAEETRTADEREADRRTAEEAFLQCRLPVAVCDERLRILRASDGLAREAGLAEERMRGLPVTDLLPTPVRREVEAGMLRVLETGEPGRLEVHVGTPAGSRERVWSVSLSPLRNPAGRVHRVELTVLDTTEEYWARERLALLNDVSTQVGSTLDVTRTAQEMADVAVGRLADFVTVDLLDPLFRGSEPKPFAGTVPLRRAAQASIFPGVPEAVTEPGELDYYPEDSPPAVCLATGRPSQHSVLDEAVVKWGARDPSRMGTVHRFGVHSIMAVPLRARGITLGVAVLVRHRHPEPFDDDDLRLAGEIAARAAVSVDNARRYTRERATALALQRSLLPQRPAVQEAVSVASCYLPASSRAGVGGDWFDVIPLSGARVALVVGDVVGHGLRASATMGRLRTAVRTLADVDLPPDELLVHLDDLVAHLAAEENTGTEPELEVVTDLVATCLYVVYDPVSRLCCISSAGHPPPALVTPDGAVGLVDLSPGPPLGVGGLPFESVERKLPEGSVLVLYTDGLVEAGGRDIDTGTDELLRVLAGPAPSLEDACSTLTRALLPERTTDDVALLVARTRALDADQVASWELPSDPAAVSRARSMASERLTAWGLEDAAFTTELVVSELVTNAIRYGSPPVRLRLIRDGVLVCEVSDGSSTAPHLRRARTYDEGGRGLLLVAQFAQRWGTRHTQGGKTIWAEIALPGPAPWS
ncbi:SpoIIE family protein phosphatase [Streptomyces sp. HB2AG]|uniref:SpoIIE family protein phosphatase n=1 Tax=Streptomyces sp. HB2AG TaxID=2983400 RepID=UPI0022AA0C1E|nr:SpoIIE family protein phosphatase [Streptomyces sp. HB2AG]MCZ2526030.1 SpoIIE family protein phosphatase [Streptomyces sp. HB2AG]